MTKDFKSKTLKMILAAMFLAMGQALPFVTGHIPQIGQMLLPMHIPVFLCGMICGWQYGGIVGFVCPILRFALFGMPAMPNAIGMAFELCAYGLIAGFLYGISKQKTIVSVYFSLVVAMISGRIVWGVARVVMLGVGHVPFGWKMFLSGAFLTAIPGIILQLILIPVVMITLTRAKLVPVGTKNKHHAEVQQ